MPINLNRDAIPEDKHRDVDDLVGLEDWERELLKDWKHQDGTTEEEMFDWPKPWSILCYYCEG
jgi:hypothetical protein